MSRKGRGRSAKLILYLVETGAETLVEQLGLPADQARQAMREVAHKLARDYGGAFLYVPKDQSWELDQRDIEIFERLERGSTVADVARERGLTERQIYAIYQHARSQLVVSRRQNPLPGF